MALALGSAPIRSIAITEVPVITPRTTIATALRLIREHNVPALPVCTDLGLAGLVTEKTLLRFTPSEATTLDVYELRDVLDRLTVERAIAAPRAVASPGASLEEAAALMVRAGAEVIPVMDGGRFVGLVTWSALLAAAVGVKQREVHHVPAP